LKNKYAENGKQNIVKVEQEKRIAIFLFQLKYTDYGPDTQKKNDRIDKEKKMFHFTDSFDDYNEPPEFSPQRDMIFFIRLLKVFYHSLISEQMPVS
jgi:hypothetical protein